MRKILFLLISFMVGFGYYSTAQGPIWKDLNFYNTQGYHNVHSLKSSGGANYASTTFRSELNFNNSTSYSAGVQDIMVFKFDNNDNILWNATISPYYNWGLVNPTSMNVDALGNMYLGVYFWGGINFNGNYISDENGNTALIKINTFGFVEWVKPFFTNGGSNGSLSFDSANNIYFNNRSANLIKLNPAGEVLWSKDYPANTLRKAEVIDDQLYLVGSLIGGNNYQFGTTSFNGLTGNFTGFWAKAELNGEFNNASTISIQTSSINDIKKIGDKIYLSGLYRKDLNLSVLYNRDESALGYYIFTAATNLQFDFSLLHTTGIVNLAGTAGLFNTKIHSLSDGSLFITGNQVNNFEINDIFVEASGNSYRLKFDSNLNLTEATNLPFHQQTQIEVNSADQLMLAGAALTGSNIGNFFIATYDLQKNLLHNINSVNSKYGTASAYSALYDSNGDYYLKTRFIGTYQMSSTTFYSEYERTLITKHTSDGSLLWFTEFPDSPTDKFGSTLAFDKSGNIVNVGLFDNYLQIGPFVLQETNSGMGAYIVKINPNGGIVWARALNSGEVTKEMTLATDQNDNIIVSYMNNPNNVLVKFDASGNKLWTKEMYMESYYLSIVSTDKNNNIFLTSEVHLDNVNPEGHSTVIDGITLSQNKNNGATAVIKFDPAGTAQWAKILGTNYNFDYSDGWPTAMKNDSEGNTYIWGWTRNNEQIGETTFVNPFTTGVYHYYLAKLNSDGENVWTVPVYQKLYGFNYGDLLEIDQSGDIYVAGSSRDSLMVSDVRFASEGANDSYIMKFGNDGSYKWTKKITQNTGIYVGDIATSSDEELFVFGSYSGNSQFDYTYPGGQTGSNIFTGIVYDNYEYTKIYTDNLETANGADFTYHIYSESTEDISPISYQFTLFYDPYTIEYQGYDVNGTNSENGDIVVNSNEWGRLYVSFMNETAIPANGLLLKFNFKAINWGETWLWTDQFYYNDKYISNTASGMVNIKDFMMGDVDYNHQIQAYDGALVLQHSAGMDPLPELDPLPWDEMRAVAADVDYDGRLTANDAALILQYSARMIDWFAQPDDSTMALAPVVNNADVEVRYIDNKISIRSYGNLIGFNLDAEKNSDILGTPVISNQTGLYVVNNENGNYAIAIANTTPLTDGTELISIPVKSDDIEKVELHLIVNTQDKWVKGSVISSNNELELKTASYPNPFTNRIYVESNLNSTIELVDMQGRILFKTVSQSNREEINTESISSGIYFIKVSNENLTQTEKMIKR